VHGTRYWDHWFTLWPWIVGWPLTLGLLAGVGYVAWRGDLSQRLVLLWCGLYFLSVGALPVKAVRYLMPLLPLLAYCTGAWCVAVWRRQQVLGIGLAVVLVAHTALGGLAFARVYAMEDSRIQAGRWIAATVPAGSRIGLEAGAFNLRGVVNPDRYQQRLLNISGLFYGSAYMLCGQQVDYLAERLLAMEWLALVEENRAVQFRAVPALFPVVDAFYTRLLAGELGFAAVQRFAVEPQFMGLTFADRDAPEPSFLAYDHPTVRIFRREESEALAAWREQMSASAACADGALGAVAGALEVDAVAALELALQVPQRYPHAMLGHLLVAEAYWRRGDEANGEAAYRRYLPAQAQGRLRYLPRSPFRHLVPGDAALACVALGLQQLALRVLRRGVDEVGPVGDEKVAEMAASYLHVGGALSQRGLVEEMAEALALSLAIQPHKVAYNVLATTAFERGDYAGAVMQWQASLALDEAQGEIHATLGQVLLAKRQAPREGLVHLQRAVELDPAQAAVLEKWFAAARAALETER
jgi:tetratricopeptide (TPR) repeat protein